MYQGCQNPFRGRERPPINSRGFPDKEMDHEKGDELIPLAQGLNVSNFLKDVRKVPKLISK